MNENSDVFSRLRRSLESARVHVESDEAFDWRKHCKQLHLNGQEAKYLSQKGWYCAGIWLGQIAPRTEDEHRLDGAMVELRSELLRGVEEECIRIAGQVWIRFLQRCMYEAAQEAGSCTEDRVASERRQELDRDDSLRTYRKCTACGDRIESGVYSLERGTLRDRYCSQCEREKSGYHPPPDEDNPNDAYNHMPEGQKWGNGKIH